jgi:hypothetical protein
MPKAAATPFTVGECQALLSGLVAQYGETPTNAYIRERVEHWRRELRAAQQRAGVPEERRDG